MCRLEDPVGQVIDGRVLDSGLRLERRRVPLGVVVLFEARLMLRLMLLYV